MVLDNLFANMKEDMETLQMMKLAESDFGRIGGDYGEYSNDAIRKTGSAQT